MHPDNDERKHATGVREVRLKGSASQGKERCELKAAMLLEESIQTWKAASDKEKAIIDKRYWNRGEKYRKKTGLRKKGNTRKKWLWVV